MKSKVFLLSILAVLFAACEKDSKNEPNQKYEHQYVDLGLPSGIKWATCNVGASKPEEYGDYFAWGETKPKEVYNWSTYFDTKDGGSTFLKYNNDGGKTTLDLADDAAHVNWGDNWRMPTEAEISELRNNCTWTWTTNYNNTEIIGYIVSSKTNNNSIFLPVSGTRYDTSFIGVGLVGFYWSSSSQREYDLGYACGLYFLLVDVVGNRSYRYYGQSVRPVCQ